MQTLFNVKNKIREVIRKYQEIIFPILRLIWCYLVFSNVHTMFHYMDLFDRKLVIFLVSVLCAVLPDPFMVFVAGAIIGTNCFVVNLEVGLAFSVVFMFMYCVYIRFFPKHAYAIFLVPICYAIGIPYMAPLIILMITGLRGAIPAAFGVALHVFSGVVQDVQIQLATAEDDTKVEVLKYFVEHFLKNREMQMLMLVFALTVVAASIVYKLSFPFSHYVALLSGVIFSVLFTIAVGAIFKETVDASAAFTGSLVGFCLCVVMELCKGVLDFKHTERVQFEDDEYYYYVKAVPKLDAPKKKKRVAGGPRPAEGEHPRRPVDGEELPRERRPRPVGELPVNPAAADALENQAREALNKEAQSKGSIHDEDLSAMATHIGQGAGEGADSAEREADKRADSNAGETSGVASDDTSKQKKPERINRSDLLAARRVEEARKARAERIERQRYEEPIGDAPEPAEESIDDFEDSGERKPKKQSNKKGTKKQGKKNVELPGDDFEDLG